MFKKDIEKAFTEKVQEYLMKGYRFYSEGMRGSQGEIAKVVLTDDKELIIIYLEEDYSTLSEWRHSLVLFVEKQPCTKYIVWLHTGTILEKTIWHDLSDGEGRYYLNSECPKVNEILAIKQQRRELNRNLHNTKDIEFTSDEAKKVILPLVRRQPKCKSKTVKDIIKIYRVVKSKLYVVHFKNGQTLCLPISTI